MQEPGFVQMWGLTIYREPDKIIEIDISHSYETFVLHDLLSLASHSILYVNSYNYDVGFVDVSLGVTSMYFGSANAFKRIRLLKIIHNYQNSVKTIGRTRTDALVNLIKLST